MICFTIPGRAAPGGSKRAFVMGKRAVIVDANKNVGAWKDRVAQFAFAAMKQGSMKLIDGPLSLHVVFEFIRPRSHFTSKGELSSIGRLWPYPAMKPDTTKLIRALEDALTAVVWTDDALVVEQSARKVYGTVDRVCVEVQEVP